MTDTRNGATRQGATLPGTSAQGLPNGTAPSKPNGSLVHRLYTGSGAFDLVGKRKRFYAAFGLLVIICLISIIFRGFNFGIEFKGGTQIQMPAQGANGVISVQAAKSTFRQALGYEADSVQLVGRGSSASLQIVTNSLNVRDTARVETALFSSLKPIDQTGVPSQNAISDTAVSGTWGSDISRQAVIALVVFLVLVAAFLTFYFERWMAVAALVALANDLIVTAGVYSIVGLDVNPATVVGLLTILGFSLYDTVVVFDKVRENTRGLLNLTRRSYPEAANLALNQTLMRSINTSLIALLPVIGLLVAGQFLLGGGTLGDLALVQLIGMLSGAMSSIFLATPLLVNLKMRERPFQEHAAKVAARRASVARRRAATAAGYDPDAEDLDTSDDEELQRALREERAFAAAAVVPGRTGKGPESRKTARPTGKSSRSSATGAQPSGKKRR
ncbi:MAG: protein translocase subunit SecF [Sciscionella sp.]